MFDQLTNFVESLQSPVGIWEAITVIGFSFLASLIIYFIYKLFYGSRHIGAGVNRTFIIGGPSITVLLVAIQTSIPLALGLLGALSIVRFRTPVKDPAEIGFLLLLIASSICAATKNYMIAGILIALVFVALGIQWLARNRLALFGQGHLMISVDQSSFPGLEEKLTNFLKGQLRGLRLETTSVLENRVSLHYQYRHQRNFDWTAFTSSLNQLAGTAKIEMFIW